MVARPLLCTGGPAERKHDVACDGLVQRVAQIPEATHCRGSTGMTIRFVRGPYACRSNVQDALYHCPMLTHPLTTERAWYVHKPCACNALNALFGRVGKCVPNPNAEFVTRHLHPLVAEITRALGRHPPVPYVDIYAGMGARKRASYQRAHSNLMRRGGLVFRNDAKVKMFVKLEGIRHNPRKINPDCRAIQFRSKEYTLALAARLRRAEKAFFAMRDTLCPGPHFAKGKNPRQRARDLRILWELGFRNVLELDASRFDAHINVLLLEIERQILCGITTDPDVRRLLEMQIRNICGFRCKTDAGDFACGYQSTGGRMSGDANTSLGNSIIMACMLTAFGRAFGRKFAFYCDGDDSVFFHDGEPISDGEVQTFFRGFGMTMAIENRPRSFEGIGFCQARPVELGDGWTMVRDPLKLLSKFTVSHKIRDPRSRASYLRTVALGELALARGCPVLQPFLQQVITYTEARMSKRSLAKLNQTAVAQSYRLTELLPNDWNVAKDLPITTAARKSFAAAWGIPIEQQLEFEDHTSRWLPDLVTTTPGQGVDVAKWEYAWRRREML